MTPPPRTEALERQITYVSAAQPLTARIGPWLAPLILVAADYGAVVLALLTTHVLRDHVLLRFLPALLPYDVPDRYIYLFIPLTYVGLLSYERLYTRRLPMWQSMEALFRVCTYVTVFVIGVFYFTGAVREISRIFVGLTWLLSFAFLLVERVVTKRLLARCGLWQRPVVIVGAGKTAELLAKAFTDDPGLGYRIVGLVEDERDDRPLLREYPLLGGFAKVEQAIAASGVQDVVIATPGLAREKLMELIYRLQPYVKNLVFVPDLFGVPLSNLEADTFFEQKMVLLRTTNNLNIPFNYYVKRVFDLTIGLIAFIVAVPLMAAIAVMVKLDSKGPVFYNATRLGKNGKPFVCYKFRTMYVNGDALLAEHLARDQQAKREWEKYAKLRTYDPRVTRVGKWLRKYSLDELPQLFNVLLGHMSLVGPRPYLPREKTMIGYFAETIFATTPGITGLWQVSGRNDVDFHGRLLMDSWYVRNWSLWLDIMLIFKTFGAVLARKGAY